MSGLKVYSGSADPQLWRILITAKYAGVAVESDTTAQANSKEILAKSPLGKVPVLETKEGSIFEANAITRYIARLGKGHLYGSNDFEAGQIEQFIDFASNDVELPGSVWVFPILGFIPNNSVATQKAKGDIRKALEYLNKHLLTRTFLVGERLTIADIVVATSFYYLYQKVLDAGFRKTFVNTNRWYLTIVNQPEVRAIIGEVKLADKMEVAPESVEVKAEEKPKKEEKPKQEKPKKEEKPKKVEEDEEGDEYEEKEVKKPNVLDSLPPSKMNLDEWKRVYSNAKDTRKDALPWFWANLDKEGYSVYFCDYKYNHELEKSFMTANLVGGWIQRLDKLRKYGFGSLIIFGQDPKLEVSGCWLFRGQEPTQDMKETDDYEHYVWTKVDPEDAAQREKVNDFFAWDGTFGGNHLEFNQGKIFK